MLTDRPLWLCHVDPPLLETALLRRTQLNRLRYGSREFGDRSSAISIGSWIFPEFLTKRPDEDVRLLAEEQSELVNIS